MTFMQVISTKRWLLIFLTLLVCICTSGMTSLFGKNCFKDPPIIITISPNKKGHFKYTMLVNGVSKQLQDTSKIIVPPEATCYFPDTTVLNQLEELVPLPKEKITARMHVTAGGNIKTKDTATLCTGKSNHLTLRMKMVDACPCRIGYDVKSLYFPYTGDTVIYWTQIPVIVGLATPVKVSYKDETSQWMWFLPPGNGTLKRRDMIKP